VAIPRTRTRAIAVNSATTRRTVAPSDAAANLRKYGRPSRWNRYTKFALDRKNVGGSSGRHGEANAVAIGLVPSGAMVRSTCHIVDSRITRAILLRSKSCPRPSFRFRERGFARQCRMRRRSSRSPAWLIWADEPAVYGPSGLGINPERNLR
jgi:hypothetical protein